MAYRYLAYLASAFDDTHILCAQPIPLAISLLNIKNVQLTGSQIKTPGIPALRITFFSADIRKSYGPFLLISHKYG